MASVLEVMGYSATAGDDWVRPVQQPDRPTHAAALAIFSIMWKNMA
jgi:hypothetical protein